MNFEHDFDPDKLQIINPRGRDFKMFTETARAEHYIRNGFEEYTADLISNYTPDGALFLDIGAHHGFYSLLVATKNKNSRIMAFEPVPENCEILKKSLEFSHLANVELYQIAVSDKNETRSFNVADVSSRGSFYQHPLAATIKTIETKTISLDSFIVPVPDVPVVIKIDTEGHELPVLEGMRRLLEKTKDIKLFIEFNPDCLRSGGYEPGELLNTICRFGFDIFFLDDERKEAFKVSEVNLPNWAGYFGQGNYQKNYFNLLCIKKEKSLNVCFFSHSAELNGAERSLLELVTELVRDHGTVCSVVFPKDGPIVERFAATGASTFVIPYSWWTDSGLPSKEEIESRLNGSFKNITAFIQQKLVKLNPDIVFTQTMVIPWGALTACSLGKPHVWNIREFGVLDHGLKFYQPFNFTLGFIKHTSNIILTTSDAVKAALFPSDPKLDVQTLYSFVSIPPDALRPDKGSYFTRMEATKLVMSGTVQEGKGQIDAVLAVKELVRRGQDIELVIMGQGANEYGRNLETLVEKDNLEYYVKFVGFEENPYPVMNQADILLMCSRSEAFGRVTVEAMLLKKPVIATNTGGSPELVTDQYNGLLYTPGDYIQLADKIEYLHEHKDKINEFGENGYQFAKKTFTREAYGGRVYKLLKGIRFEANPLSSPYSSFMTRLYSGLAFELQEKNKQINNLNAGIQQNAARISALEAGLQQKACRISDLEDGLQQRGGEISKLENSVQQKASRISDLEGGLQQKAAQINNLENQVREIQSRIVIQLGNRYQRVIERLLRSGAIRRKYYEIMLTGFRVILNEGFRVFWRKFMDRWRKRDR